MLKSHTYEDNYTILNKLYKQEQNSIMTTRLKNAKSLLNTNCPNSFNNSKKKKNKSHDKNDMSKIILFNNIFYYIII